MRYASNSEVKGLRAMKFTVAASEFANETVNPDNAGFCTPLHHCIPSGLLNNSAPGYGQCVVDDLHAGIHVSACHTAFTTIVCVHDVS